MIKLVAITSYCEKASLALQQIGFSVESLLPMTDILQSVTHDIVTTFNISINKYFPTTPPHQGSGHGNGVGPTI